MRNEVFVKGNSWDQISVVREGESAGCYSKLISFVMCVDICSGLA